MESIHRNIILDLLPAYVAGEVSEESRNLVEMFARHDPQIERIIRAGAMEFPDASPKISAPDRLERKTIQRVQRSIRRQMAYVAMATAALLMVPFVAMQFTGEVVWSPADFIVMGVLLAGTGLTYVMISRVSDSLAHRAGVAVAVMAGFLLIWLNLAVGIIGAENNPANLLYIGVILVGLVGSVVARFRSRGMARALFATAFIQMLVPVIALLLWRPSLDDPPGILGVFLLNAFFTSLFAAAGLLFRFAARSEKTA